MRQCHKTKPPAGKCPGQMNKIKEDHRIETKGRYQFIGSGFLLCVYFLKRKVKK
jgi:hypothetical protein